MNHKIRKLNNRDLNCIMHLQPEGWHDIIYYFNYFTKSNCCYPICVDIDNKIIAVGNAITNKDTGWLSHIIVDKNFRNQGLGYNITKHLIDFLLEGKYHTISLIATAEGELLYKKLGFKIDSYYLCYQGKKLDYKIPKTIIKAEEKHFEKIKLLDQIIVHEDRSQFMSPFMKEAFIYIDKFGEIHGYFIPIFNEGPVIARNYKVGIELLKYKHFLKECRSIVPEINKSAILFFKQNKFIQFNRVSRMFLGNKLDWHQENVYSRVGGYIG